MCRFTPASIIQSLVSLAQGGPAFSQNITNADQRDSYGTAQQNQQKQKSHHTQADIDSHTYTTFKPHKYMFTSELLLWLPTERMLARSTDCVSSV